MAINLTITVPEELHKRLQEVKKNFNVSQVCQKAIETEVKRQELLLSGREDLNDVIKRFRLEHAEYFKSSRDLGYKYGLHGLSDIPLKAMEFLCRHSGLPVESLDDIFYEGINNCIYSMGELHKVCQGDVQKYVDLEGREIDPDEFLIGFYGAMLELFEKIQDQIYKENKEADNVD